MGGVLLGALAGLLCASGICTAETPEQPVQYNHNVHVEQLAIPCTKCHWGAERGARASFPPDVFCEACHSSPQSGSAAETQLIKLLEAGKPLAWKQVTRVADYVYFSHRRHVVVGNIDCVSCHGDMGARTVPIEKPVVNFSRRPGMLRCLACHEKTGSPYAGTGCVDCHR